MNDIDKILKIMRLLEKATPEEKKIILKRHKNNSDLKEVLLYTYNPYFKYGITEETWNDNFFLELDEEYDNIFDILDILRKNNINDSYRSITFDFINKQNPEVKELYKKILFKNLNIGLGVKTINKIFSNLIPEFNIQLAHNYSDYVAFCHNRRCTVTEKLDGHRAIIINNQGTVDIYSRSGKKINKLDYLIEEASQLPENYVYDGELLPLNIETKGREYQEVSKILKQQYSNKKVAFHIFDVIPINDFRRQKCPILYRDRKAFLKTIDDMTYIKKIDFLFEGIFNKFQLENIFKKKINELSEGLMINFDNGVYEFKRTKNLLKVKSFDTIDCIVIGMEKGRGKYRNVLGNITIRFEYNGNPYTCKCGVGFSDYERDYFYKNKTRLIGKVIEVQYFDITLNDKGEYGLRFPVFKRIREEL